MNLSMTPPSASKRRLWPLLVLVCIAALGVFFLLPPSQRGVELEDIHKEWMETGVTAPFSGTVQEVFARAGDAELPPGAPIFSYDVAAMREELQATEAHAESLAQSLPPAARALAQTPDAVSAAMQERRLVGAGEQEQTARRALEDASDRLAQSSVQAEQARARRSRGELSQTALNEALARRDDARAQLLAAQKTFESTSLGRHKEEETLRTLVEMERSLAEENTPLYRRFTAYKAAAAAAADIREALNHARVSLGSGGIITGIDMRPGDPVTAGQVVARVRVIPDPARLMGRAASLAPESVGAAARVRLTSPETGEEIEATGVVESVTPDGTGSFVVITLGGDPRTRAAVIGTPEADIRVTLGDSAP